MPMYFSDLKSVRRIAEDMQKHEKSQRYTGIIPKKEEDLPEARKQLGKYFREVWGDTIQALEIELAVNKDNYEQKMRTHIALNFLERNQ